MKLHNLLSIALTIICSACFKNDKIELPSEVLTIQNNFEVDEKIFAATPTKINDSGDIIGYTDPYNGPLSRYYEQPNDGFYIKSNKTDYASILFPGAYQTWPLSINNNKVIIGAYLSDTATKKNINTAESPLYRIPCMGFVYFIKKGEYQHIGYPGYSYTIMEGINDMDIAYGAYGNDTEFLMDKNYFFYDIQNRQIIEYDIFRNKQIKVCAMNNKLAIVNILNENGGYLIRNATLIFDLISETVIDSIPLKFIEDRIESEYDQITEIDINDINNHNQVIGTFLEFDPDNWGYQGFLYKVLSNEVQIMTIKPKVNRYTFVQFELNAINDNGIITGIGNREDGGLPQARAFAMKWDFTGFKDVTPENGEVYADAYDINNSNEIIGFAGFQQHKFIVDRPFVVKF